MSKDASNPPAPAKASGVTLLQLEAVEEALRFIRRIRAGEMPLLSEAERVEALLAIANGIQLGEVRAQNQTVARFVLVDTREGEQLAETRGGATVLHPRCSREIYYAVAQTFAEAEKPLSLDEIGSRAREKLSDWPSGRKLYLLLKFWLSVQPSIIVRHRCLYCAADPRTVVSRAVEQWVGLRAAKPVRQEGQEAAAVE